MTYDIIEYDIHEMHEFADRNEGKWWSNPTGTQFFLIGGRVGDCELYDRHGIAVRVWKDEVSIERGPYSSSYWTWLLKDGHEVSEEEVRAAMQNALDKLKTNFSIILKG